jgi:hypothetical protein
MSWPPPKLDLQTKLVFSIMPCHRLVQVFTYGSFERHRAAVNVSLCRAVHVNPHTSRGSKVPARQSHRSGGGKGAAISRLPSGVFT